MSQLRVLHIVPWFPHPANEIEGVFILEHITSLKPHCHNEIIHIQFGDKKEEIVTKIEGIKVKRMRLKPLVDKWKFKEVASQRFIKKFIAKNASQFDLVNFQIAYPNAIGIGSLKKKFPQLKFAIIEHWPAYHENFSLPKEITSVHSPELIGLVFDLKPDLIIINGTRILPNTLIASISCPLVNIHVGITPQYRGVHGGYWALKEGNPHLYGVTLHDVDKGIDTGQIIAQKILVPTAVDNFKTYPIQQYIGGIALLEENLEKILANEKFNPPHLTVQSQLHYHPTLIQYLLG